MSWTDEDTRALRAQGRCLDCAVDPALAHDHGAELEQRAADEIERLKARVAELEGADKKHKCECGHVVGWHYAGVGSCLECDCAEVRPSPYVLTALRLRVKALEAERAEILATMAGVVPVDVHERGWQWRPTATDTAFAPPFGTIRRCRVCGCLVAGGPTACARCAEEGD